MLASCSLLDKKSSTSVPVSTDELIFHCFSYWRTFRELELVNLSREASASHSGYSFRYAHQLKLSEVTTYLTPIHGMQRRKDLRLLRVVANQPLINVRSMLLHVTCNARLDRLQSHDGDSHVAHDHGAKDGTVAISDRRGAIHLSSVRTSNGDPLSMPINTAAPRAAMGFVKTRYALPK